MVTLLIVGVVLTLGIPNLSAFTQNSRMTGTANDLHSSFQLARSEAARAKTNITICGSANPMDDALADCDGSWEQGYIVFVDSDGDIVRDVGEPIVRSHPVIATGVTLNVEGGATSYFSFAATGQGAGDVLGAGDPALSQIVMCDERGNVTAAGGNSAARLFVTTPLGRATVLRDKDRILAVLTAMGATCP